MSTPADHAGVQDLGQDDEPVVGARDPVRADVSDFQGAVQHG